MWQVACGKWQVACGKWQDTGYSVPLREEMVLQRERISCSLDRGYFVWQVACDDWQVATGKWQVAPYIQSISLIYIYIYSVPLREDMVL